MTMPTTQNRRRWWVVPLTMLVGGLALTVAASAGAGRDSSWVFISGVIFTLLAAGAFVAIGRTRGDVGAMSLHLLTNDNEVSIFGLPWQPE